MKRDLCNARAPFTKVFRKEFKKSMVDSAMNRHSPQEPELHEISTSSQLRQTKDNVDIRPIKTLVFAKFPKDSAIYDVLFTERDLLSASEFLIKVDVWLRLLRRLKN